MKPLILPFFLTASAFAATPSIGIVTASGHFTVQGSQVWGNATLFDGASVETGAATSELTLRDGAKIQLAADSKAQVFADHVALERGSGQVARAKSFELDAGGLKIRGAGVRVGLGNTIEVAALSGPANVMSQSDRLIAAIPTGRRMSFAPQQNAVTTSGCLLYKDNHFIIQDQTTQVVSELNGDRAVIQPQLGNRVTVTGTASTAPTAVSVATRVINVTGVEQRAQGGCLVAAQALEARTDMPPNAAPAAAANTPPPAAPKPAAAGGGGMSKGAKTAIWVAVAGGGAGGAIVALHSGKKSTSP